jgi:hypothetical protein
MALNVDQLNSSLASAFSQAMYKFLEINQENIERVKNGENPVDLSNKSITEASKVFSDVASPAIQSFIKSATIIIPIGGVFVATPAGPATNPAPTAPAQIS